MPNCGHRFVVVAAPFQLDEQRGRQLGAAQAHEALDLRGAEDRQDARDDRHGDALRGEEIAELEVVAVVEEQLRDDEVGAVVDLRLQPLPVDVLAFAAGDVPFGKPGDADREVAELADELAPVDRSTRSRPRSSRTRGAVRRIAAQREDVLDARARASARAPRASRRSVALTQVRCAIAVICCSRWMRSTMPRVFSRVPPPAP